MGKVVCLICGKEFKRISPHIKVHNLSIYQYKEMFPNAKTISEESHQKSVNSHLGDKLSQSHKDNIGKSLKGKMCGVNNPAYGKPSSFRGRKHTEESKQKNREKHLGKKRSIESCKCQSETMKKQFMNGDKEVWCQGKTKETEEGLRRKSESMKGNKNPNHGGISDEHLRNIFRAVNMRPNKKEIFIGEFLCNILLPYNIEYKYVGDGELVIHGKCPDFVIIKKDKDSGNIYGKKLIEFNGDFFHKNDDEGHRIFYFRLFGYETLIVCEHELKDLEKLRQRILDFHNLV